ncbi:MAG TPA: cysteine desulfurase family protein [Thermoanaerobaculia bacterium]|nr:cysteine desulfurase family protein [Thermoanaerobaculia bacterium]
MDEPIYLDYHATTPCDPRVLERMLPFFTEIFGNPAAVTSAHGRRAATALEDARASVAGFLGVRPAEVKFTAGSTESNNTVVRAFARPGAHVITSAIEHKSILEPLARAQREGARVTILPVDREGFVDPGQVRAAITPETTLVTIMAANAEIGTIEPLAEIGAVCRAAGVPLHSDATQAIGKIPFDPAEIGCDLISLSAHKLYGPKGVGALIVRRGRVEPLLIGGGQEKGARSGTVNVPGAVGLAAALELRRDEMAEEAKRLIALRDDLRDRIVTGITDTVVNGPRQLRLPGNLNVSFRGVESDALLFALRRFSLSSGSACSAGEREPSYVLKAIGLGDAEAMGPIRIGLGKHTRQEDLDLLVGDLRTSVARLREMSAG